ncbi:MAG: YbhB/YbcL family Raf kinase inhibitor-like protein [Candidatus Omnitrophota bacterium]
MRKTAQIIIVVAVSFFLATGGVSMGLEIKSKAFKNGEYIPAKYTCNGDDVSPPLSWDGAPNGTKSFALICNDPDAPGGNWVHWVVYCIPADVAGLKEGMPKAGILDNGAKQGMTDFRGFGYGGPCPPPGKPHRYFFRLYALDIMPDLMPGLSKRELQRNIQAHVLGKAELIGLFKR